MQIWWPVSTGGRLWRDESFNARPSTSSESKSFTSCDKTFGRRKQTQQEVRWWQLIWKLRCESTNSCLVLLHVIMFYYEAVAKKTTEAFLMAEDCYNWNTKQQKIVDIGLFRCMKYCVVIVVEHKYYGLDSLCCFYEYLISSYLRFPRSSHHWWHLRLKITYVFTSVYT